MSTRLQVKKNRIDTLQLLYSNFLGAFSPTEIKADREVSPDIVTASDKYKLRFASETGKWFLDEQAYGLLSMLDRWETASILDVGGGHGQYTRQLIDRGDCVTIMGGAVEANAQVVDLIASDSCRYIVSDLSRFPFPDKSFDIVISFRLMSHLGDWQNFIAEASRVAKYAVIIDLPVLRSFNFTYPVFFKLKRKLEGCSTRSFNVFAEQKVLESFHHQGFRATGRYPQFLFPMVIHRVLNSPRLSRIIEKTSRALTLTNRFGSPVILRMEPDAGLPGQISV